MAITPIRNIQIRTPGSETPTNVPVGALAENVLMSDATGAQTVKAAIEGKADATDFTGATSTTAGSHGLVPAPAIADRAKYLKGDGTWDNPPMGVSSVNNKTGAVTLGASDVGAIATTAKGAANGVAELDANGKVPSSQLPSYVDDVIEVANYAALPTTGEAGKIYITKDTNKTYRWSGTGYVEISASLALGETDSTAYRGDRGKVAYDHSQDANAVSSATAVGLYKVGATAEGHISGLTAVAKSDITGLGIPGKNTEYNVSSGSVGSASGWNAGSVTTASIVGDTLEIVLGVAPSLSVSSTSVVTGVTEKT